VTDGLTDPSNAQRRASTPAVSAWVDASAGSGKTKVLTDRVLALLLSGARPHAILCLTFTKAAAGEMANRIAGRLAAWARIDEPALAEDLAALAGELPEPDTLERARRLFAKVQDAPGGVRIETMHAFCQGVLQRFPAEAGVAPHFEVLDDRDKKALLAQVRDSLVQDVVREPEGALALAWQRVIGRLTEHSFDKLVSEIIGNRTAFATADLTSVATALEIAPDATRESVIRAACRDGAFAIDALRGACGKLSAANAKIIRAIGDAIAEFVASPPDFRDFDRYARAFLTDKKEARALAGKHPLKSDSALLALIEAEQSRILAAFDDLAKAEALADTAALLTVANEMLRRYAAAKRVRSRLDYDDLIDGAARLLVDPGAAWVHYKLDGGIDHVLVDEAQDTSSAQWQVIAGLIAEFFAGETAREAQRTFFAVGDPKQSIYSFQGADPAEFHNRRSEFSAKARASGHEWRDVPLNVSFRSAPPVLRLVDAVFADNAGMGVREAAVEHFPHRHTAPGWVEVWPLVEADDGKEVSDVWTLPTNYEPVRSGEEALAATVALKIKHLIASGEVLAATGKPIRPGDIMVLVRRRRRFGGALVAALKRLDVPVAGVDRMALARELVVEDLVALGRFVLTPADDLTLAAVLKGPFFGWSEDRLFRLAYRRPGTLWDALRNSGVAEDAADAARLQMWLDRAPWVSPFAFYSSLLAADGGRMAIRTRLGPEADDPLEEFLALTLSFPQHGPPTLQHFLHWLSSDDIEIKRELDQGERDEVRLLTVHAAKGLQAPIVFLPDTAFAPRSSTDSLTWCNGVPIWAASNAGDRDSASRRFREQKDAAGFLEEARLLYVALTRAEDRLYIGGWQTKQRTKEPTWYERIRQACEQLCAGGEMLQTTIELQGLSGSGFAMGNPPLALEQSTDSATSEITALPDWALAPAPAEPEPSRPLSPSRPTAIAPAARSPLGDKSTNDLRFRRGTLLHRLFQFLPGTPAAQRVALAASILHDAGLSDAEMEMHVATVSRVLDDPVFSDVFSGESLAEAPLTGLVDGQAVRGVVDRLLITETKVLIVDYKSNRRPPAAPEGIPQAYRDQMLAYYRLLRAIYPQHRIEAALLWTEIPRLDPVPVAKAAN
jgi:ATP-dependent helicase/nuclease subunit A